MVSCFCRSGWFLKVNSIVPWCRVQSNRSVCEKANIRWGEEEWGQLLGVCVCVCVCVFVRQDDRRPLCVCLICIRMMSNINIMNIMCSVASGLEWDRGVCCCYACLHYFFW